MKRGHTAGKKRARVGAEIPVADGAVGDDLEMSNSSNFFDPGHANISRPSTKATSRRSVSMIWSLLVDFGRDERSMVSTQV
jgi:hypothetical protein